MRLLLALLLALSVALAGCADDEGTPVETLPPDDGAGVPPDEGAENATGEANETPPEETTPPPPEPVEVYNTTFDFSQGDATGQTPVEETATVPAGHGQVVMNVTFQAAQDAPTLNNELKVTLVDPAGTEVGSCIVPAGPQTAATPCSVSGAATAGDYVVRYTGVGTTKALVTVVAV